MSLTLLWSSEYDKELCEKIYECEHCDVDCYYGEYLSDGYYDRLNDFVDEHFNCLFLKNDYKYFVIDSCYEEYDDKGNEIHRFSELFDDLIKLCQWVSKDCGALMDMDIYKGKYNSMYIKLCHHDGTEWYQICRLNKLGRECYNKNYDIDYNKYAFKSVCKDFYL